MFLDYSNNLVRQHPIIPSPRRYANVSLFYGHYFQNNSARKFYPIAQFYSHGHRLPQSPTLSTPNAQHRGQMILLSNVILELFRISQLIIKALQKSQLSNNPSSSFNSSKRLKAFINLWRVVLARAFVPYRFRLSSVRHSTC